MVKFLDSSVFLHAYLRTRKKLSPEEEQVKHAALEILRRVEEGEVVATSVVHLSEAVNIVETRLGLKEALKLLENSLATENLTVLTTTRGNYEEALAIAARYKISPNDALAALLSRNMNITGVYSFDKHFDNIPFIERIAE
ncbi:MAG: tRNA(fMet)-specific endonuclease VapC [Candidatus Bathyarchaeota archaeon BA1]|nr:MAG: tRNA(fMet)-specific endonuclease VapC [Candidatus Bathyarchaeota archaeon BA1]